MTKRSLQSLLFLSMFSVSITSCVDDAYDLNKDVDLTITVGGDISTPGSSTEKITLEKIFELDDDSDIKVAENGDYSLQQSGNPSNSDVTVDVVDLNDIETTPSKAALSFKKPDATFEATSDVDEDDATFSIKNDEVTKDIRDLKIGYMNMPGELALSVKSEDLNKIKLKKGFSIIFPDYVTVTVDANQTDFVVKDNHIITFNSDIEVLSANATIVNFHVTAIDVKKSHELNAANGFTSNENAPGKLAIADCVKVQGVSSISSDEFVGTSTEKNAELLTSVSFSNSEVVKAEAIVDPKIDINIDPIKISNLPDFLDGDDAILDIEDPKIVLTVNNEAEVDVNFTAELIPFRKGAFLNDKKVILGSKEAGDDQIIIPGEATNYTICIHRKEGVIEGYDKCITVENLNDLIEQIPDEIHMQNVEAKAIQNFYTIALGETKKVNTNYEITAPLAFGSKLNIPYDDTMTDWDIDLDELDIQKATVTMEVVNTIPLAMNMEFKALDKNGNVLDDITAVVKDNKQVAPGTGDVNAPVTTELTVELTSTTGAISKLDGMKYLVNATSGEVTGKVLNENQSLTLQNIRIKIPGGVKYDLN